MEQKPLCRERVGSPHQCWGVLAISRVPAWVLALGGEK